LASRALNPPKEAPNINLPNSIPSGCRFCQLLAAASKVPGGLGREVGIYLLAGGQSHWRGVAVRWWTADLLRTIRRADSQVGWNCRTTDIICNCMVSVVGLSSRGVLQIVGGTSCSAEQPPDSQKKLPPPLFARQTIQMQAKLASSSTACGAEDGGDITRTRWNGGGGFCCVGLVRRSSGCCGLVCAYFRLLGKRSRWCSLC